MSEPSVLVVVSRYGDVPGGAEAHARSVVQHLKPHFAIEVATTTATDYLTWKSALTAGTDSVDGVTVRRFPVERPRAWNFKLYERRAFRGGHTLEDERAFIDAQGPYAPELLDFLYASRAIAYNTEEERRMVWRRFRNERVSNEIVGVGIDVPAERNPARFRTKYGITGPYLLYVGRIGVSKGSRELFANYERWRANDPAHDVSLVLIGDAEIAIPKTSGIVHLGRLSEQDKWDALAGSSAFLMPSLLESLSLVTLEAWAAGRPVIVDARSPVLAGMARRAGAGLAYRTGPEFAEICELLADRPELGDRLGAAGAAFVARTYTWPRVVETYIDLFAEVRARLI
ncbi:MAG: glycosyltransferase family 4 protein [Chloroflexi bacterium]|nr:MAG: glycosyltransferase family 4 protein [Chloroflexota bacterium]